MDGEEKPANAEGLPERISLLEQRLTAMNLRLTSLEASLGREYPREEYYPAQGKTDFRLPGEEGVWAWLGRNAVLPRVAAVCFMLVFALLLRTVTDNGWIGPGSGTAMGLAYVSLLLVGGWRQYAAGRNLAPVFVACGLLLLFSIIAESRFHFTVLPAWLGAALLCLAAAATLAMALRYRAPAILWLSGCGATIVIFVLDFPNISFPAAALIIILALAAAVRAAEDGLGKGLRWLLLLAVFFLFSIWGYKLVHALKQLAGNEPLPALPPEIFAAWFAPLLLLFLVFLFAWPVRRLLRGLDFDLFFHLLPMAGAGLLLIGGRVLLDGWLNEPFFTGLLALAAALAILVLIGFRLRKRQPDKASGVASFGSSAALLLFAALPLLTGNFASAQIIQPLLFIALLVFAQKVGSGNLRLLAAFLALTVMASGLLAGVYAGQQASGPASWLAAASAGAAGLYAYFWCRRNPAPENGFFLAADPGDYTALVYLLHGLLGLYFLASLGLNALLAGLTAEPASLACARSILINIGAAMLIAWGAMLRRTKEIAATGIVIALIGGGKVFFSDLLNAQGLPLALSVSSFGALAALCSVVLSNWQGISSDKQDG